MKSFLVLSALLLALTGGAQSARAQAQVYISEFMAKNTTSIVDEDGAHEDWIEIFNAGTTNVSLLGWGLTDNAGSLKKWTFPVTNIGPGKFIVVWASEKNRKIAGAPLHTNFKLSDTGEFLALVRPDNSIASQFSPTFPVQAQNVSYGVSFASNSVAVLTNGAAARVFVPTDNSLSTNWLDPLFDDSSWSNAVTAIGFDTNNVPGITNIATDIRTWMHTANASAYIRVPFTVADPTAYTFLKLRMKYDDGFVAYLNGVEVARRYAPSFAVGGLFANNTNDWVGTSAQGVNNWSYGYYNRNADANLNYDPVTDFNTTDPNWVYTGGWILGPGDPPWTSIGQSTWHPNGSNQPQGDQWAIRRWISEANGTINARITFAKSSSGGNGTTLRVFVNGLPKLTRTIAGSDTTGFTTNLVVEGLNIGDSVDFAIDALGTDLSTNDGSDGSTFGVIIDQQASPALAWNSTATIAAPTNASQTFEEFDITAFTPWLFAGTNVLAIQGVNISATDADFYILPEIVGSVIGVTTQQVYFAATTPNSFNGLGTTNLGPVISSATHTPKNPIDSQDLLVTATVEATLDPVSTVVMYYRVNYAAEVGPIQMFDDGLHADGAAADGVWGATIPQSASTNGQMVRYRISATDSTGDSSRSPLFDQPLNSPEYWGTVVADLSITSNLPVMHWFTQNPAGANTTGGARGSIHYNGQFFDNVDFNLHGQSSSGFPKKSYDINLNQGYKLTWRDGEPALGGINLLTTWADKTFMRSIVGYGMTFPESGSEGHFAFGVRIQQNGAFFSVANFVENGDEEFLDRLNLDENGALYKMYNTLNSSTSGVEKKTRKTEGNADLQALLTGLSSASTPAASDRYAFLFDNVNLPQVINHLAARHLAADTDWGHKNYYLYRDSNGSGQWQMLPWDIDLSWGHNWTGQYFDDTIITNSALFIGSGNTLVSNIYANPLTRAMFTRRIRTLMEQVMQTNGTPAAQDRYLQFMKSQAELLRPDVALDIAKWGSWTQGSTVISTNITMFDSNMARMTNYFLPGRRTWLFNVQSVNNGGPIPNSQPAAPAIALWQAEVNPANSNQSQEWLAVTNYEAVAVDISGWSLGGGVRFTFAPGTVIPPNNAVFIARDLVQFRARTVSPKAGETRLVVGPFSGGLDARGEGVTLANAAGSIVGSNFVSATPSPAQLYLRITEIMYNPAPGGTFTNADEYEYLEVKNISTNLTIDLRGVFFTNGITFSFNNAGPVPLTNLTAGQTVVLVKNPAAFVSRYGTGPILGGYGIYTGSLDNGGERIRLLDANGEEILDFTYNDTWYPITDGAGYSLAIVDPEAPYNTWDEKSSWRPSGSPNGTPGTTVDAPLPSVAGILINEVLTHTDLPQVDAVELHNPTAGAVDLSGWYLTDSFGTPRKFRIPNGTTIPAGGYLVFTETNFNATPGNPTNFSFSSTGEEVYLFSGDSGSTNLTGYIHGFTFGAAQNGVSFGRYVNSQGETHFVAQSTNSLGSANVGPKVGPVIITEIMYRPPDNTDGTDNNLLEYIEVYNSSAVSVPLFDPAYPTNQWRLANAVDFTFPTNFTLGACDSVVIVSFNPATDLLELIAFTNRYPGAAGVSLLGPWSGKLDNSADSIELKRPDSPNLTEVPYITVEKISFTDASPWADADGNGLALRRVSVGGFGNDATNWVAAAPTPGATTPVIATQPQNAFAQQGSPTSFTVVKCGTQVVTYQWRFNGAAIVAATNATLSIPSALFADAGNYSVILATSAGSTTSSVATLTVNRPPVAGGNGFTTTKNQSATYKISKLLGNDTDADGDTISFVSVDPTSTNGATIVVSGANVIYSPVTNYTGADRFSYNIVDSRGGTAVGLVDVFVADSNLPTLNLVTVVQTGPNSYRIRFAGVPGRSYLLQRSPDLINWTTQATLVAPLHGIIQYDDPTAPPGSAFYRLALP